MGELNSHSIKATVSLTVTIGTLAFTRRSQRCTLVHWPYHPFCHVRLYVARGIILDKES